MRTKEDLKKLDNVNIIYKYLYMDEKNRITFNNGLANLTIRMNENFAILCKNENFPDLEETYFGETFSISYAIALVDILKEQPPVEHPNLFKNRWEEIETLTKTTIGFNNARK